MSVDIATQVTEQAVDALLVGFGLANRAVAAALTARGHRVVAIDDAAEESTRQAATDLGIDLVMVPSKAQLEALVSGADVMFPTPGLPEWHPAFELAASSGLAVAGELDLARAWDDRPVAAITGTNGKTTVVELCVAALNTSGVAAVAAGNTEVPLVTAIEDRDVEVFVVEASSFRLAHAQRFSPRVATWLNFAADHLDVHRDLESYELAKASIWAHLGAESEAVANREDPVVMRNLPRDCRVSTFGGDRADWRHEGDALVGPDGDLMAVADLWRSLPHDVEDALAAAATVAGLGATMPATADAFAGFSSLAHRVERVAEIDGVVLYDDSKATTPHATVAALKGFSRVVLIAGGRNKGVPLAPLRTAADRIRSVVAIGEAAPEIEQVFAGVRPVRVASDMDDAVQLALEGADPGSVVLLSPGCASFDWYRGYGERGDDFARAVRARATTVTTKGDQ